VTRPVDSALSHALQTLLFDRHTGRTNAATAAALSRELADLGRLVAHPRRIGEAVAHLVSLGVPVCATSSSGYFMPTEASDIEAALAETEKRARRTLLRRRFLRAALSEMRGQRRIAGVGA
jgi:hypothetical protein